MSWVSDFTEMLFPLDPENMNIEGAYGLKYRNLPPSIFKFRAVTDYSIRNLEESKVWLADPRSSNDPYDCAHSIDIEQMINESNRKNPHKLGAMLQQKLPADVIAEIQKSAAPQEMLIAAAVAHEPIEKRERTKSMLQSVLNAAYEEMVRSNSEQLKGLFKLCSFSERLDSTLMWAHYANYHKGFCIEYDVKALPQTDFRSRFLYPVIYSDRLFDATPHFMKRVEHKPVNILYLNMAALVKATDWSYEKEWRLLFGNGVLKDEQAYAMPTPKAVYLGSHIESINQQTLIDICVKQKIPVQKMKHSPREFLMVPCSIEEADRQFPSGRAIIKHDGKA